MFFLEIGIIWACLALIACIQPTLADDIALELRDDPSTKGVGWLLSFCDDDWNIFPKYWFYAKCGDTPDKREWHHIDLTNCYTVTADGRLAGDNWRQGGMDEKCDRCQRCGDLRVDACLQCRCNRTDGKGAKAWTMADMDGLLFWGGPRRGNTQKICCGEWWGGPYCGESGMPPEPSVPGIEYYLLEEGVD